jgi:threonine/homoserine/homoserine lactone efflux protein
LPVDYLLFLQIVFFLCITPGAPRIVITTYAINYGLKRSAITAFGDISANTIQMIFVAFGIGAIIATNPEILDYAKWVGIIYLLYLAFDLKRSSANFNLEKNLSLKSNLSLYRDGFVVAFFSPKAWIFFGAIFPQFLNLNGDFKIQLLILILSYVAIDFSTLIIYGFVAKKIVTWLKTNPKTINLISAYALLIIAIILVLSSIFYPH